MPEKKLYFIYYRSDAANARDVESEFDGVIWLTEQQFCELVERGYSAIYDQGGEFEIHPVTPYEYNDVDEELKHLETENA